MFMLSSIYHMLLPWHFTLHPPVRLAQSQKKNLNRRVQWCSHTGPTPLIPWRNVWSILGTCPSKIVFTRISIYFNSEQRVFTFHLINGKFNKSLSPSLHKALGALASICHGYFAHVFSMCSRSFIVQKRGPKSVARYDLANSLGSGSFGAVLKATDRISNAPRAWKALKKGNSADISENAAKKLVKLEMLCEKLRYFSLSNMCRPGKMGDCLQTCNPR